MQPEQAGKMKIYEPHEGKMYTCEPFAQARTIDNNKQQPPQQITIVNK